MLKVSDTVQHRTEGGYGTVVGTTELSALVVWHADPHMVWTIPLEMLQHCHSNETAVTPMLIAPATAASIDAERNAPRNKAAWHDLGATMASMSYIRDQTNKYRSHFSVYKLVDVWSALQAITRELDRWDKDVQLPRITTFMLDSRRLNHFIPDAAPAPATPQED
jgi:hypothetical protein